MKMSGTDNRVVAGISVPGTGIVDRALEYARQRCEPYLFNHVVRSWLFATRLGQLQNIAHDAEVVAVSAKTGMGLDDLRAALARVADRSNVRDAGGPVRLYIDRVFTLRGIGTVVTGTLWSGTIAVWDPPSPTV